MARADALAADLRRLTDTEPTLRQGSFSAAMEEVSRDITIWVLLSCDVRRTFHWIVVFQLKFGVLAKI